MISRRQKVNIHDGNICMQRNRIWNPGMEGTAVNSTSDTQPNSELVS